MTKFALSFFVGTLLVGAAVALTPGQPPEMPKPVKEHGWLKNLEGEWEVAGEMQMEPSQPVIKSKGDEKCRPLGGFWIVSTMNFEMMGMKMESVFTVGYDPEKKKYVGTWVDGMTPHLWKYEGDVDSTGKVLTLNTEGPSPVKPGTTCKFKEVITLKDKDHRTFSSSMLGEDGKWTTFVRMESRRKK